MKVWAVVTVSSGHLDIHYLPQSQRWRQAQVEVGQVGGVWAVQRCIFPSGHAYLRVVPPTAKSQGLFYRWRVDLYVATLEYR